MTVTTVDLHDVFQEKYVSYAYHTLTSRAIPDVRDGLKPVHRRILYAMQQAGFTPSRPYVKSAKPVAQTMGNYHPHGDTAIYDALVRLAQPWAMRYPLVDGQGNFGSRGNDGAAAMRYTESRLATGSTAMLDGLNENTVDMVPNYDEATTEPTVLPARLPMLLINGADGIAVGATTNLPPHNPHEVAAAARWALTHSAASTEERHQAYFDAIPGPDFPTGGAIRGTQGIRDAYTTGRGRIILDGVTTIEEGKRGAVSIVITEVPYGVNVDQLTATIGGLATDGKLPGVTAVEDETSEREGLRIVITCKAGTDGEHFVALLRDKTTLRSTVGVRMLAVDADGVPRDHNLGELIDAWIEHQITVVVRRAIFRRDKAAARRHIVAALIKAVNNLDAVISAIRNADDDSAANIALQDLLDIDRDQASAILSLPLRRITRLGITELRAELAELDATIELNQGIIDSPRKQRSVIRQDMDAYIAKIDSPRRTTIHPDEATKAKAVAAIAPQETVVCRTSTGYLWRTSTDIYRRRNGGADPTEAAQMWPVTTTTPLIGIDTHGGVHRVAADIVPLNAKKPVHPASLYEVDTPLAAIIPLADDGHVAQLTSTGHLKLTPVVEYATNRSHVTGMTLPEGATVLAAIQVPSNTTHLSVLSARGHIVTVQIIDVRISKRTGGASAFYKLAADDHPVAVVAHDNTGSITIATAGGFVKRIPLSALPVTKRGSRGVPAYKAGRTHGPLLGAWITQPTGILLAITDGGPPEATEVGAVAVTGPEAPGQRVLPKSTAVHYRPHPLD